MSIRLRNLITIGIVLFGLAVTKADFPENPQPCKFGDTQCIHERAQYFFTNKFAGDKSINLNVIDPLSIPYIPISRGKDRPFQIELVMKNNIVKGLKKAQIVKASGFGEDMTKQHELVFKVKNVRITGDYTMNGKVMILPIIGTGKYVFTLRDVTYAMQFNGKPQQQGNNGTYMQVDKLAGSIDPEHITYKFGNLFNGNKLYGDSMNNFINSQWKLVWNETSKQFIRSLDEVIRKILNDVFATRPYNKFFLED